MIVKKNSDGTGFSVDQDGKLVITVADTQVASFSPDGSTIDGSAPGGGGDSGGGMSEKELIYFTEVYR